MLGLLAASSSASVIGRRGNITSCSVGQTQYLVTGRVLLPSLMDMCTAEGCTTTDVAYASNRTEGEALAEGDVL